MKLLFHVQHMLGVGHRVRAERIACACADAGFQVTLMEGGVPGQIADGPQAARINRVLLPPAKAADSAFSGVIDAETGCPIDDAWRARRRDLTLKTLEEIQPDVLLVEGFPFARRAFRFELDPLVTVARTRGVKTAVSIRDILVARPDQEKTNQIAETAHRLFDAILVHGDPNFVRLEDSFTATDIIRDKIVYTGVVAPEALLSVEEIEPVEGGVQPVIVSAGGGATGGALMRTALSARPLSRFYDNPWRLLMGPNLPNADRAALKNPPQGVIVEPARPDFQQLLSHAALSISQAGYNTVADLTVTGCPAVLIPFEGPNGTETEQPMRARLLERAGRVTVVREGDLRPEALAKAIDAAADLTFETRGAGLINGARETASALARLIK